VHIPALFIFRYHQNSVVLGFCNDPNCVMWHIVKFCVLTHPFDRRPPNRSNVIVNVCKMAVYQFTCYYVVRTAVGCQNVVVVSR